MLYLIVMVWSLAVFLAITWALASVVSTEKRIRRLEQILRKQDLCAGDLRACARGESHGPAP